VLSDFLLENFLVKLDGLLFMQAVIDLSILRLDHIGLLWITDIGQSVLVIIILLQIVDPIVFQVLLVLPRRIFLLHQALGG